MAQLEVKTWSDVRSLLARRRVSKATVARELGMNITAFTHQVNADDEWDTPTQKTVNRIFGVVESATEKVSG